MIKNLWISEINCLKNQNKNTVVLVALEVVEVGVVVVVVEP